MKRQVLIDALKDMQENYELSDRITDDRLDRLVLQAQINIVRDLRERLVASSAPEESTP